MVARWQRAVCGRFLAGRFDLTVTFGVDLGAAAFQHDLGVDITDGVVQVNSWGGTTKQYNVDVDPNKLDAFNVTIPQIIAALGNANINVGGREITVGQQSVNIRGIGLFNSGGNDDITQGYHVEDIENVVLG